MPGTGVHHVLFYDYVENIVERRAPHRELHLAHVGRAREAGILVQGGALGDPPHTGMLTFRVEDPAEVEAFAQADPYVREGLVTAWRVEPWNVVAG
jgi:uncharacterized protein YciI